MEPRQMMTTLRFLIPILVLVTVSCGVVKKPSSDAVCLPGSRKAAVERLADLSEAYVVEGADLALIEEEQQLLQAWLDGLESLKGALSGDLLQKHVDIVWDGHDPATITRLLPASRICSPFTENKLIRQGVGLPVVAWVEKDETRHFMSESGRSYGLTARLKHRPGKKPLLTLLDSMNQDFVKISGKRFPLAADFSAHSDFHWEISRIDNRGFMGLFCAEEAKMFPRLYLTEDYDPTKIPVIFVHGLTSSPVIWAPVGADLRSQAELRDNYQIWHFSYPTGPAWVNTAAAFRQQVKEAREKLDPRRKNPNWDKMVIVGHSMGGLVTRTAVSIHNDALYKAVFNKPLDELEVEEKEVEQIRRILLANPLPEPSRVIFIATPHRGSGIADWGIVQCLSGLILLPSDLAQSSFDVVTRNQYAVSSSFFVQGHLPTGLDTLSTKSPFIQALESMKLQEDIKVHSIVGVRGCSFVGRRTDGVVPYRSAHLDEVESEVIVPYCHGMTEAPLVKKEVLRILTDHLED